MNPFAHILNALTGASRLHRASLRAARWIREA